MTRLLPLIDALGNRLFRHRRTFLLFFVITTMALAWSATGLRVDAGFAKTLPLDHPYIKTFNEYPSFRGANRLVVALRTEAKDIYSPEFLDTLKKITDEVFFVPGVNRPSVSSLFTPNVRYLEVTEEGFSGGDVAPANFDGSTKAVGQIRANAAKSDQAQRLTATDQRGALIVAELLDRDPNTGEKLDYRAVAHRLEEIRSRYEGKGISIHIIGFAKAVGDIADGARSVVGFFAAAFLLTGLLLYAYSGFVRITLLVLACALVPVIWLLGLLPLLGYGIDPLSILVPFLIFAIGVSHAVQMTGAWRLEILHGADSKTAAHNAFLKLFIPGTMALLANAVGFLVMLSIDIPMVRELAVTASLGVALMVATNKMFLTILLSWLPLSPTRASTGGGWETAGRRLRQRLAQAATSHSGTVLAISALLILAGTWEARHLNVGDLGTGVPELASDSRYNRDNHIVTAHFGVGSDILSVIAQAEPGVDSPCTDHGIMEAIRNFQDHMQRTGEVERSLSLASVAEDINARFNEGNPRWRTLPLDPGTLAQSVAPVPTGSGLLNADCSAMPILLFLRDHRGTTIARTIQEIDAYATNHPNSQLHFYLASGNAGVMAATNETVASTEGGMLLMLFAAIGLLCLVEFHSWRAALCILAPLALAAILCNAAMAAMGIGLKVATLPVIALGVGVGVDYGIYLFDRIRHERLRGHPFAEAFETALAQRGNATLFTGATLAIGVGTWAFSPLKFQADMGILLAFMFLINVAGSLLLMPALASRFWPDTPASGQPKTPAMAKKNHSMPR